MKCHFKAYCLACLSAASVLALVGCGGGGDGGSSNLRADNSPHHFVLDGQIGGTLTIRGVIMPNSGWEIGTDQTEIQGEAMLTFEIMADGTLVLTFPPSSLDSEQREEETYSKSIQDAKWWEGDVIRETNHLGNLEFEANDETYGIQYRGKNICMYITTVTPDETMDHESPVYQAQKENNPDRYIYTGYTISGTMTVQRNKQITTNGTSGTNWFTTIQLHRLPAIYTAQF